MQRVASSDAASHTGLQSYRTAQAHAQGWWAQALGSEETPLRVFTLADASDVLELGTGGFGTVYSAKVPGLDPEGVVLKVAQVWASACVQRLAPMPAHSTCSCCMLALAERAGRQGRWFVGGGCLPAGGTTPGTEGQGT